MKYPAAKMLEFIQPVEQCNPPVQGTLAKFGIPTSTFFDGYPPMMQAGWMPS